jgi:hypothetical protein
VATIGFQPDLYDLGHVHVVWDDQIRAPVQDPAITGGSGNVYGPADVFQDAGGNVYAVSIPDGTVRSLNQQYSPPASQQSQPSGNQVQGGAPSPRATTGTLPPGAQTGAVLAGTAGGIGGFFTRNLNVGQVKLPVWAWLAGLGGGYYMLNQRGGRRR